MMFGKKKRVVFHFYKSEHDKGFMDLPEDKALEAMEERILSGKYIITYVKRYVGDTPTVGLARQHIKEMVDNDEVGGRRIE